MTVIQLNHMKLKKSPPDCFQDYLNVSRFNLVLLLVRRELLCHRQGLARAPFYLLRSYAETQQQYTLACL